MTPQHWDEVINGEGISGRLIPTAVQGQRSFAGVSAQARRGPAHTNTNCGGIAASELFQTLLTRLQSRERKNPNVLTVAVPEAAGATVEVHGGDFPFVQVEKTVTHLNIYFQGSR